MRDGNQEGDLEPQDVESLSEAEYPIDRLRQRVSQSFGNRPIMVYFVLIAGAATLILLLAIVWISATGGGTDERPICTSITTQEAEQAILGGQVSRINVLVDRDDPLQTLSGIVLEMSDKTCRQPAQGADVRNDLYLLLGVVEHYNSFGEQRIRVHYQRQEIQAELLVTSTPTPAPTLPPTETPTAAATETVMPSPSPTGTATATVQIAAPTGTAAASPGASAIAGTATATATVSATEVP